MLGLFKQVVSTARVGLNFAPARGLKTHKGAAKRWWVNGSGEFIRKQAGRRHGNIGWSRGRILRHLNGTVKAAPTARHRKLKFLLPFAK